MPSWTSVATPNVTGRVRCYRDIECTARCSGGPGRTSYAVPSIEHSGSSWTYCLESPRSFRLGCHQATGRDQQRPFVRRVRCRERLDVDHALSPASRSRAMTRTHRRGCQRAAGSGAATRIPTRAVPSDSMKHSMESLNDVGAVSSCTHCHVDRRLRSSVDQTLHGRPWSPGCSRCSPSFRASCLSPPGRSATCAMSDAGRRSACIRTTGRCLSSRYPVVMDTSQLRETLAGQLRHSQAQAGLAAALEGLPAGTRGPDSVAGHCHTAWQQVEHMRLAAEDLIAYCQNPNYEAPELARRLLAQRLWSHPRPRCGQRATATCSRPPSRWPALVEDPEPRSLCATSPPPSRNSHHTLRAALILLDHNGYHAAQVIALRQALGIWPAR